MPVVTIPSVGEVEFPDTMDADSIQRASAKLYSEATTQTATSPAATTAPVKPHVLPGALPDLRAAMGGQAAEILAKETPQFVADRPEDTERLKAAINEGLPFKKLAPTDQQVRDARDVISAFLTSSPNTSSTQELLEGPSNKPQTADKITAGAVAAGLTIPETMTSPLGIATLGAGAAGPTAARIVSGAFTADMARHTPEQVVDVYEAFKLELGPEEATKRIGALTLSTAMLAASAKHAATAPKTPGEVAGEMLAKKVETTEFVKPGDLLPQPKVLEIAAVKAEAAGAPATAEAVRAQAETVAVVTEPKPAVPETIPPTGETKAPVNWDTYYEDLVGNLDSFSPARDTGKRNYAMDDVAQRFVDFAKEDKSGKSPSELVKEFAKTDEATAAQIKKLRTSAKDLEQAKAPVAETISPPAETPAGAPPVVDVTAPSATRTPEAGAVESPATPAPKWTQATFEPAPGQQLLMGVPDPVATFKSVLRMAKDAAPYVKSAGRFIVNTAKEVKGEFGIPQLNDRRRAVLNWSAKLQQSFGEADSAQRDIRKQVPDAAQRDGITNWIQAGGDAAVLAQRAAATTDPSLKAGYEAAMNLTPEALAVAKEVKLAYDTLGQRGRQTGVLNSFVDNYVTQIWNLNKGPAMGSSRTLKDQFRFAKARTFDTFFDGEQAGYTPKTKDISQLLPVYLHEMNAVIAARQLVAQMGDGVASDGRPLTAPSGNSRIVDGADGQAVLVTPKTIKGDTADYKRMENQPALNDWVWAGKDTDGKPIFLKSDLKLHPEAYAQLKNVLGRSAIKEWYDTRTSLMAEIPKAIVKGIDVTQVETKKTMLGFFAPFHQVQEGTHAVGHRINPFFNNPKIDLVNNAAQMDAARHGLMLLPDRVSANNFMEGFRTSGLISKIPGIGKAADWYQHYLFHEYIPGLKFKTYEAIVERNTHVYEKDIAAGKVSVEDVKALSASQANAAYGHLNYADLARNPTIQHLMRLGLLAPDFLEARARFAGQAIKGVGGAKVGREQVLAIATLAITQATLAYIAAETTGGEWDGARPFEFTKDGRRYTMRSVPEDAVSLMRDVKHVFEKGGETPFISHRLSPLVGRGGMQLLSGRDYRGRQVTPLQTAGELAKTPIPLTLRGAAGELPWVGDMLKPNTSLSIPEQLWSAVGIKISVDRPVKPEKPKHEKPKYKP